MITISNYYTVNVGYFRWINTSFYGEESQLGGVRVQAGLGVLSEPANTTLGFFYSLFACAFGRLDLLW